jgi:hypothetical protein
MGAGRPYQITAKQLALKFEQYKKWLNDETFSRPELIKSGERAGETINVQVPSPPDVISFCQFAGISVQSLYNYCSEECEKSNRELFEISMRAKEWISSKQIRGAAAGVYNHAIVARLNGLKDVQQVEQSNPEQINISIDGMKIDLTK